MKEVKVGLIGLGFMGTTHLKVYAAMKGVRLTALCDVDPEKRRGDIGEVTGNTGTKDADVIALDGVKTYASAFDLVADPEVDLVDICVPTPLHADIAIAALKAGKHVHCEKPLCRNAAELKRIVAAARRAKGFFNVEMTARPSPEYAHAREFCRSGKAGKVRYAFFRRVSPNVAGNAWKDWYMDGKLSGGALVDLHVHDADQVNCFFGKPRSVRTSAVCGVVSRGAVDHVATTYDYGDGTLVISEGGWAAGRGMPFEKTFMIVGDKATLKLDANGYRIFPAKGGVIVPKLPKPAVPDTHYWQVAYFADCVRKGVRPDKYQTIDSVETTMKMVFAEEKSAKSGKAERV